MLYKRVQLHFHSCSNRVYGGLVYKPPPLIYQSSRARSGAPLVIKIHLPPIQERVPHPRPFVLIIAVESAVLNVVSDVAADEEEVPMIPVAVEAS